MKKIDSKWLYLLTLSLIWGSSFILIKKGLIGLNAVQLGALRIVFTGLILLGFGYNTLKTIKKESWKWVVLSGIIASFIPAFLFAIAETEIDSAVVSVLNSLVPINTILIGIAIFGLSSTKRQVFGIITGFVGTCILILAGADLNPTQNYWYSLLIVFATILYATNVNIIKRYLQHEKPLAIAVGNFVGLIIPAFIILIWSDFFSPKTYDGGEFIPSVLYVLILSVFGTALAKTLFNKMVQIANPVFASSVTYLMPIIALIWGLMDGESFGAYQLLASLVILLGVYLANYKSKKNRDI